MPKRKRPKNDPLGTRRQPATPLFVRCPTCGGACVYEHDGEIRTCLCGTGFVETGFTQERYDALIRDNDRILMLLDDLCKDIAFVKAGTVSWTTARRLVAEKRDELEAARSRTEPKDSA